MQLPSALNLGRRLNFMRSPGDPKIIRSGRSSLPAEDKLARWLGWFSLGLGATELIAPRRITRALGMEGNEMLVRAYGAREIGAGLVCLSVDKGNGLWGRVGGDALDIVTLLTALRTSNRKRANVLLALTAVGGITVLDVVAAQAVAARHRRGEGDRLQYRDRSGFPKGLDQARGAARNARTPADLRAAPQTAEVSRREDSGVAATAG